MKNINCKKEQYIHSFEESVNETDLFKKINEDRNVIIFHHTDMDGICSAQLVLSAIQTHFKKDVEDTIKVTFVPYNYYKGINLANEIDKQGENVVSIIVDLSLKGDLLSEMIDNSDYVLYIDHHLTTVRELIDSRFVDMYDKCKDKFDIYVNIHNAAVMHCYKLFEKAYNTGDLVRYINEKTVSLVDKYDRFAKEESLDQFYVNAFAGESNEIFINSDMIKKLLFTPYGIDDAIKYGKEIYDLNAMMYEVRFKAFHKDYTFKFKDKEYRTAYLYGTGNSLMFGDHINDYAFVILVHKTFVSGKQIYRYSLYSSTPKMDVSEIARFYGGGGHKQAAGFSTLDNILE